MDVMARCYVLSVRTTLTLDDDVSAKLREHALKSGSPFNEIVNQFLRLGLKATDGPPLKGRFVVKARPLGLPTELAYDDVEDLIGRLEGSLHR